MFGKILGLIAIAGAGLAAVKVAKKYDENKQAEILDDNYESTEKKTATDNLKQATKDVYADASKIVKEKATKVAEDIGIDTEEMGVAFGAVGNAATEVGKALGHAGVKVAQKVKDEAPAVIEGAVKFANDASEQIKNAVENATDKFQGVRSYPTDAEVCDAEYDDDYCDVEDVCVDETETMDKEQQTCGCECGGECTCDGDCACGNDDETCKCTCEDTVKEEEDFVNPEL